MHSEDRAYELLVQAVVDYAIYMLDPTGKVSSWNSGAERIKGYQAQEVMGSHFSRFYTPEDRESGLPERALRIASETGRFEAEGWRVRKDGTRFWAAVVIDAIKGENGELVGFAKVTRDMTEKREAEQRLAETREQLFQSQKIEALGQLTGGLAHDFNNLLTAIISGAELALRSLDNPDRVRTLLERVKGAAERGGGMTGQLLAFARRQPLEPRTIDLRELLPQTTALLRHSVPANIELVTEVTDQLWLVEADPGQLELALLNLGFNARDAMPDGGTLRISARNATETSERAGPYVIITVVDTGEGMEEEVVGRVFEPFFTTKGFGQGTGLGLSQVYGFAMQSRGDIKIASKPGEGTTVSLSLPAVMGVGRSPDASEAKARVLLVEDDAFVGELACELLRDLGYSATMAHSAAEGLTLLSRERFDAVFSDVVMPGGLSGLELARRIRGRYPEMPILLTTGYSETIDSDPSEFPVLPKPYRIDQLDEALAGVLGRRAP